MAKALRLTGLVVGDDPAAWAAMGMPVVGDRVTVGGVTIRLAGADGTRGVLGWELDPPVAHDVDGLLSASATRGGDPDEVATGRGYSVVALDHVAVTTDDVDRTTRALAELGLEPRRTVDAARGDPGVRYRFWILGTCVLEVIGPVEPGGSGPASFAGVAFTAPDLGAFADVASDPRPAVQPGRDIATIRTGELGVSVPVAVLTPRPLHG